MMYFFRELKNGFCWCSLYCSITHLSGIRLEACSHELQALGFKPSDSLANKSSLDPVRLDHYKSALQTRSLLSKCLAAGCSPCNLPRHATDLVILLAFCAAEVKQASVFPDKEFPGTGFHCSATE